MRDGSCFELLALNGDIQGQVYLVEAGLIIGRSTTCDIFVADRRMSRRHAYVAVEGNDLIIEDLNSHNGTFINGKRVQRVRLFRGDVVRVGDIQFEVIQKDNGSDTTPVQIVESDDGLQPTIVKKVDPDSFSALRPNDSVELGKVGDATGDEKLLTPENFNYLMERTRHFVLVYEASKLLHEQVSPELMCSKVLALVLRTTNAERGFIAWVIESDEGEEPDSYVLLSAKKRDGSELHDVELSRTVAELVLVERNGVITSNAMTDKRFATSESVVLNDVRSLMAVPMLVGPRVLGLIDLESSDPTFEFTENDLDLLSVVGSMLGAAVDRLLLAQQRERTIAELKDAQRRLLQTQDQLVRTESMAAIGRFASGIAHEVKNHLAPFMLADMLARTYPDDEDVQESVELMLEAQRRILGLIDEIRHFASGASSNYEILPYDIVKVVEGVIRFVKCDARVKQMEVVFSPKGRPLVDMDAGRMRQVFINLIRNAADAITHDHGCIEILLWEERDELVLQFVDNGEGIPLDVQAHVFEPFYTTKGDLGLGLGLDISRKIIQAHGGSLTFNSDAKGTTFQIVMPMVQDDENDELAFSSRRP